MNEKSNYTNNSFLYSERLGDYEADNLLQYEAGPITIRICGWTQQITLETKEKWEHYLNDILCTAKEAWELRDDQIKIEKRKITIKYEFKNINLYISHAIIFM